jgi:hypothetical protein
VTAETIDCRKCVHVGRDVPSGVVCNKVGVTIGAAYVCSDTPCDTYEPVADPSRSASDPRDAVVEAARALIRRVDAGGMIAFGTLDRMRDALTSLASTTTQDESDAAKSDVRGV